MRVHVLYALYTPLFCPWWGYIRLNNSILMRGGGGIIGDYVYTYVTSYLRGEAYLLLLTVRSALQVDCKETTMFI